jgi:cell wall-associated NlpC family hydrolase
MASMEVTVAARAARQRWDDTSLVSKALLAGFVLCATVYVFLMAVAGMLVGGLGGGQVGYAPSTVAVADIPPDMLTLYRQAGDEYHIDWAIIAGIYSIETDHGRSTAPGVHSGVNAYGCCAGPGQFNIKNGPPSTWDAYGQGGDVYDPKDAVPATARMLVANGAPQDYHRAILAYNNAEWYVSEVEEKAALYRGAAAAVGDLAGVRAKIISAAEATLSTKTGYNRYSEEGALTDNPMPPAPDRTDCSQWARAIYLAAGAPDPGTDTLDQISKGTLATHPQPGDLMFSADGGHVEIYVGGGKTIGHGSPPIDYGTVDYYPGHFFMTYGVG